MVGGRREVERAVCKFKFRFKFKWRSEIRDGGDRLTGVSGGII